MMNSMVDTIIPLLETLQSSAPESITESISDEMNRTDCRYAWTAIDADKDIDCNTRESIAKYYHSFLFNWQLKGHRDTMQRHSRSYTRATIWSNYTIWTHPSLALEQTRNRQHPNHYHIKVNFFYASNAEPNLYNNKKTTTSHSM